MKNITKMSQVEIEALEDQVVIAGGNFVELDRLFGRNRYLAGLRRRLQVSNYGVIGVDSHVLEKVREWIKENE
jgi:hypothetical protein